MLWKRVKERLSELRNLFKKTSETTGSSLEEALILADVGNKFSRHLTEIISKAQSPVQALREEITKLLDRPKTPPLFLPPEVIMVVGVNGSGKTTTVAKLAHYLGEHQKKVLVVSADTYRDAANLQLEIWAKRAGVDIVTSQQGQDGASVAYDGVARAVSKNIDCVLVDTAGRLHTRVDLLEELKKIKRVIGKVKPGAPEKVLLTIDATLGQNSIRQAVTFNEAIGITGLVLTKLDGTAKGGAIIPIVNELNIPVEFLCLGEDIDDIVEFDAKEFADALFS